MSEQNMMLQIAGTRQLIYKEEKSRSLDKDEVRIKIRHVSLCGSDRKLYSGDMSQTKELPITVGHEWVGEVIEVGTGLGNEWKTGDIVTGDCSIYCDDCDICKQDKNQCTQIEKRGITINGACARYYISKAKYLYHCKGQQDIKAYALTEPLAVVLHAIHKVSDEKLKAVKHALVIGAGGIGYLSVFALHGMGIPRITVVDVKEKKLENVSKAGLDRVSVTTQLGNDEEVYDLIIEASGSGAVMNPALKLLKRCGSLVCIGHQKPVMLEFEYVIRKALGIYGSIGGTGNFEEAIELIERYKSQVLLAITKEVAFVKANEAFEDDAMDGIKTIINL